MIDRSRGACLWFFLLFAFVLFGSPDARAQAPMAPSGTAEPTTPILDPASPEAARALVATLSDQQVRELLLQRLDAVATEKQQAADQELTSFFDNIDVLAQRFVENFPKNITYAPRIVEAVSQAIDKLEAGRPDSWIPIFALKLALISGVAFASARVFDRLAGGARERIEQSHPTNMAGKARILLLRFLLDASAVVGAFLAALVLCYLLLEQETLERALGVAVISVISLTRLGYVFARLMLAPKRPDLRLMPLGDVGARALTNGSALMFFVIAIEGAVMSFMLKSGMAPGSTRLGFWLNTLLHAIVIGLLITHARHITTILAAGETPNFFARAWPYICSFLVFVEWAAIEIIVNTDYLHLISDAATFFTLFILAFLPIIDTGVRAIASDLAHRQAGDADGPEIDKARAILRGAYIRCGRVVLGMVSLVALFGLWGVEYDDLPAAGLGGRLALFVIDSVFIILIAYALWEAVSIMVAKQVLREGAVGADPHAEAGGEGGGQGGSRLGTVMPLLAGGAKFAIVVLTVLVILSDAGVNVGPLIAGAGIVGLAIGFGAQTLVKDIVSGLFFLIDDAFRVGEYVDIGGTMGTVEKISVRSLRLRHHRGALHTVPYGEIQKLTNYSRDWVIVKLKFRVPFETDVNLVKRIFKQIGKDLLKHPEIGQDFLEPFKSQGVFDFDDSGIVVRGKFMAKPGKQFLARREVFVAVQKAFEQNGIEFARRQVMVQMPGAAEAEGGDEALRRAASAAAETAAAEEKTATADRT